MRILLYNPPRYHGYPVVRLYRSEYIYNKKGVVPPMDLAYFASALNKKYKDLEVKILDANGENLTEEKIKKIITLFSPNIIVVKATISTLSNDLMLLKEYKNEDKNVKIILSCRTCIGMEKYILKEYTFIDGIARGEIDAFVDLVSIIGRKNSLTIKGLYTNSHHSDDLRIVEDLNENPIPMIEALPNIWYKGYHIPPYTKSGYFLIASRGCPFRCSFCPTGGIKGHPFYLRKRKSENVIEEIKLINSKGIRDFYFFDEIFTLPNHAEIISKKITEERLDVSWRCEGKVNFVTDGMLRSMKRAGCDVIFYGLETVNEKSLKNIKKEQTLWQFKKAILLTKKNEIKVGVYLLLGLPDENWKSIIKLILFLLRLNPDLIMFNLLSPYPGTKIFEEMKKQNLLLTDKYTNVDRHLSEKELFKTNIKTKYLTPNHLKVIEFFIKKVFFYKLK
jgi:anaerobic magnesium-protoporphyrin IX monomethyl ester cyclase